MNTFERNLLIGGAAVLVAAIAALVAGCSSTPLPPDASVATAPQSAATAPANSVAAGATPVTASRNSGATTPKGYRQDAATHVYGLNKDRIYKGRLPPLLYAIGVLQVDLDSNGAVRSLNWMRKPSHAPEVVAEIERTVRAASPYPAPVRMGRVTWTDTWLWHQSGRFQLDTLTEGQD
jgi:protein TonB